MKTKLTEENLETIKESKTMEINGFNSGASYRTIEFNKKVEQ